MRAARSIIACGLTLCAAQPAQADATSFFVLPGHSSGDASVDAQLRAMLSAAMTNHGLLETSPEEADAVVIVHVATADRPSRPDFYRGWGGWDWSSRDGSSHSGRTDYKTGTLVVDMFDASTKRLLWEGTSTNAVSVTSGIRRNRARQAIEKMVRTSPADIAHTDGEDDGRVRIIFSPVPAVLVRIDGEPRYAPIVDTPLERVVNTDALLLRNESGIMFLRVGDRWMESYSLYGPWSPIGILPKGAFAQDSSAWRSFDRSSNLLGPLPAILVSTTPAELVVTDGAPEFVAVDGTALRRLRNATTVVYREPTDQQLYVHLTSGWFRAWTTNGPWECIAAEQLPADLKGR